MEREKCRSCNCAGNSSMTVIRNGRDDLLVRLNATSLSSPKENRSEQVRSALTSGKDHSTTTSAANATARMTSSPFPTMNSGEKSTPEARTKAMAANRI